MTNILSASPIYRLYDYEHSGNTYKIKLLLHQLQIPYESVHLDILQGETQRSDFSQINPFELVPVLERISDGSILAESNAILWYLAEGTPLKPSGAEIEADLLKWMFFEQNVLEPNIGGSRRLLYSEGLSADQAGPPLAHRQNTARHGLGLLDKAIATRTFLVSDSYSIADIAVFAYVHVAPQGGISLDGYLNIKRWLTAVEHTPGFLPLDACGRNQ